MRLPSLALLLLLAVRTAAAAPERAADDEARRLYDQGMEVYRQGRFDEAIGYLKRAYGLSHKPGLLYAIAQTASAAAEPDLALDYFQRYLGAVPDAPDRTLVEARIAQLKKLLGRDRVALAPAASSAPAPAPTPSPPVAPAATAAPASSGLVAAAPPPVERRPLTHRAWFWCAIAGGVVVAGGALALGLTLGATKVYPSSPLPPAHVQ